MAAATSAGDAIGAIGAVGTVGFAVLFIVVIVLGFLMPLFIVSIRSQCAKTNLLLMKTNKLLEEANGLTRGSGNDDEKIIG